MDTVYKPYNVNRSVATDEVELSPGEQRLAEDLFDLVDRVEGLADDVDVALRLFREGELTQQQFVSAMHRVLFHMNEEVDELCDTYRMDA
jgi:hypothetical protein